jgi:flagellar hook assembly protein FlgD
MKKLLLLTLAIVIGFAAFPQKAIVSKKLLNTAVKVDLKKPVSDLSEFAVGVNPTVSATRLLPSEQVIGTSFYDLWSNAAYSNRFYRYDDGSMVAVWTKGMEATSFPDRGTGYNVYDGSAWGPAPTARIEAVRTGWGSYAPLGLNGEVVAAHNGTNLEISKRDTRFSGAWTESAYVGVAQPTWPKIVTSGDEHQYLHIFYHSYNEYGGMPGAIIYTRSADGGATWDPADVIPTGMGPEEYFEFQSEEYAVASKGDVVAIFVAGTWADMFVLKSVDNGENWEKIMVRENPYPFFDFAVTLTDTMFACDNSAGVAIDNNGKVHVVFGMTRVLHDVVGTTYTYFPYVDGIGYWNEDMPEFSSDLSALAGPQYGYPTSEMIEDYNYIGYMQDVNGNGTIDLLSGVAPFGYRSIGPSTMPTITIDDQNRVFVAFASTTEGYDNFTNNFKKIWARAYDNGIWGPFLHVTADIIHIFDESINPLFAQSSDDNVYLIYNTDGTPGIALDGDHDYQENSIWFSSIPKTDVLTGIGDNVTISNTSVSQNYPNPFNGITTITVNLEKAADLSMTVSNILGQQVMNMNRGNVSSGTYYFQVDGTDLQDGVYFYTVKANNTEVTKKMIVR